MDIEQEFVGRTFDDFLFRPQKGVVNTRKNVELESDLSQNLTFDLPVISSNMDSVTGSEMGKTMALEGGFGFIHRALSIEDQARYVQKVKRSHGYTVEDPLSLPADVRVSEARSFARKHDITGILIEEEAGSNVLAGLLSNRDMPWMSGHEDRPVSEFMTPFEDLVTADPDISIDEAEQMMFQHRIEKLPLVGSEREIEGLVTKKDIILFRKRPHSTLDRKGSLRVGAAIGARGDYLDRAGALIDAGTDVILMDIAHGHSEVMEEAIRSFRSQYPDVELICGNVGTPEGARMLADLGADAVKVGVGPGSGCRTRLETAAGVPQLQAVREVWCELQDEIPIIADGGISDDKDVFLSLICGASSVMLGSMLSGTDESPGHVIKDPATGEKKKIYRGMTSPQAVLESSLSVDDEQGPEEALDTPPEGQEREVRYKGSVSSILSRIRGHLSSAVSYAGEDNLRDARHKIVKNPMDYLIPLSDASYRESYKR